MALENKYIYRKHLRKPGRLFLLMGLMIILPYIIITSMVLLTSDTEDKAALAPVFLILGVLLTILISIEFLFFYFVLYRRFKKIYIILTEDGIIYNNARGEIGISYENIRALKFPSIQYIGGWVKIIHNNGNIRLTVVLENIGDMVKTLKSRLDDRNISGVYDDKAMYKFFKTANYSDQSWERIYENIKLFIIAILVNLVVATIFAIFMAEIPARIFAFAAAMVGPVLVFIITEIIFGRKLAKGASEKDFFVPDRDKQFEFNIYKWAFGIYTIIYLTIIIMLIV